MYNKNSIKFSDELTERQREKLREIDLRDDGSMDEAEHYGTFLQDGDYEEFMPACFMEQFSEKWLELRIKAQIAQIRALWILKRFSPFKSSEWRIYHEQYVTAWSMHRFYEVCLEKLLTGEVIKQPPRVL